MPLEGETIVPDVIRGEITYHNSQIYGRRSCSNRTGCRLIIWPMLSMIISWRSAIFCALTSGSALHRCTFNLYEAFGWEQPVYAHLPLVMNPSGKGKLSKRTQSFD